MKRIKFKNLSIRVLFIFFITIMALGIFTSCKKDKEKISPKTISFNVESTYISIGQSKKVSFSVDPSNAEKSFTWTSSDETIATIDNQGTIKGVKEGKVTIEATSTIDTSIKGSFDLTVYTVPTEVKCRNQTTELFIGSQTVFKLIYSPVETNPYTIWTSSNPDVLTIDSQGTVTPVSVGTATIRGVSDGNHDLVFERELTVLQPAESIDVDVSKSSAYIGETIKINYKILPSSVSQTVSWETSNENIATVDENGVVTVHDRGEFVITVRSQLTPSVFEKIKFTGLHELLDEENSDVKYIICAPGTNASTMISINYHAKNTKTSIEYTLATDPEFTNLTTVFADGRYFEELSEELSVPFEARNIYSAEITDLTPNTAYIYRINKGDGTYSETYNFTTASDKGDNFSFVWLTDNHYNTIYSGAETSEFTIHEAMKKRNGKISFVLDTGDMIDTGGNAAIWELMFEQRRTLLELPMVSTTGNHELYISGTGQWDNRFHAAYNALPKNGVEKKVGTSCYFYYNDVLFIMFEDVSASSYDLQYEWMENLLRDARENNRAKMVIAACHAPIQSEDPSNSKSDRDVKIMTLFEKYAVDLVLTGHYHADVESKNYWQGKRVDNPLLGVNYLIGASAGAKGASDQDPEALKSFAKGYIVDIDGITITVTQIDANGNEFVKRTYTSKKYEEVSDAAKKVTKDEIVDSLKYTLDTSTSTINFTWSNLAYNSVDKIIFKETTRNTDATEIYIINSAYTTTSLPNVLNYYDSKYEATIYFTDGTTRTKNFEINRGIDLGLDVYGSAESMTIEFRNEAPSAIRNVIEKLELYIDDKKVDSVDYVTNSVVVKSHTITGLKSGTTYTLVVKAINTNGVVMFTNSVTFTVA